MNKMDKKLRKNNKKNSENLLGLGFSHGKV